MRLTMLQGNIFDKIKEIPDNSIDLCITSPPYWGLRDYGVEGQLGNEPTMEAYLDNTMRWVKEVWRILKPSGSFVLNIGDTWSRTGKGGKQYSKGNSSIYKNSKLDNEFDVPDLNYGIYKKYNLISVSSFAYCRIISETDFVCRGEHLWCKPNVPSPIRSRLKHSHEKLFWFVKDADKYYFDEKAWIRKRQEASIARDRRAKFSIPLQGSLENYKPKENDKNREVIEETIEHSWRIISVGERQKGFESCAERPKSEHIAPFPSKLIEPYVLSLCPTNGMILDPFLGSGTTMRVAMENDRDCIGIELNPSYLNYAKKRVNWGNGIGIDYVGDSNER